MLKAATIIMFLLQNILQQKLRVPFVRCNYIISSQISSYKYNQIVTYLGKICYLGSFLFRKDLLGKWRYYISDSNKFFNKINTFNRTKGKNYIKVWRCVKRYFMKKYNLRIRICMYICMTYCSEEYYFALKIFPAKYTIFVSFCQSLYVAVIAVHVPFSAIYKATE